MSHEHVEHFFNTMRSKGWTVRIREVDTDRNKIKGTIRQLTLSVYAMSIEVNGHIISAWGNVYLLGDALKIECEANATSGLAPRVGKLEKVSDVGAGEINWLVNAARTAGTIKRGEF
jgi:hypothetical protein